ncbi:hypothetical protein [Maridesulfovibrio sp.]|uniref:hypothetical protein n=1 Tax=Maridesulfovibrio sp. TaxID=2795000 RepID=UPI002A187A61|nr:hypothetical protein [Maridesulfovibrio sp.]
MKKIIFVFFLVICLLPINVYAGRTSNSGSLINEIRELSAERNDLLMSLLNELTRALNNDASMIKGTFEGDPMLWMYGNGEFRMGLNRCTWDRCYRLLGNVKLKVRKPLTRSYNAYFMPTRSTFMRALYKEHFGGSEYQDYFASMFPQKKGYKKALASFENALGKLDALDKEAEALFKIKLSALFPKYVIPMIPSGLPKSWKYYDSYHDVYRKYDGNSVEAARAWYKQYAPKRMSLSKKFVSKQKMPKKFNFAVETLYFEIGKGLSNQQRFTKTETVCKILDSFVEKGKATYEKIDVYDVYTDATSKGGMLGRILINRQKQRGFWEPAMFSYMDNIYNYCKKINSVSDKLRAKVLTYATFSYDEAKRVGDSTVLGDIDAL